MPDQQAGFPKTKLLAADSSQPRRRNDQHESRKRSNAPRLKTKLGWIVSWPIDSNGVFESVYRFLVTVHSNVLLRVTNKLSEIIPSRQLGNSNTSPLPDTPALASHTSLIQCSQFPVV